MNPFPSKQYKELYLASLRVLGIKRIEVNFSGSGDNGAIDYISTDPENCEEKLKTTEIQWPSKKTLWNEKTRTWDSAEEVTTMPLYDITMNLTYDALGETNIDWINNDGGQGNLVIDFSTDPITLDLNVSENITTTQDYQFSLNEEE